MDGDLLRLHDNARDRKPVSTFAERTQAPRAKVVGVVQLAAVISFHCSRSGYDADVVTLPCRPRLRWFAIGIAPVTLDRKSNPQDGPVKAVGRAALAIFGIEATRFIDAHLQCSANAAGTGPMKAQKTIHLFRYGATGLYALTDDPSGRSLPVKVCPFGWHFEKSIDIAAGNRARFKPALTEIARQKVYLTHAAFAGTEFSLPGSGDAIGEGGPLSGADTAGGQEAAVTRSRRLACERAVPGRVGRKFTVH
jgi:hypothetical protein